MKLREERESWMECRIREERRSRMTNRSGRFQRVIVRHIASSYKSAILEVGT